MLVRFLSDGRKEIVTGFNLIDKEIKRCGQSLANCIGFAMDGASDMVGGNNSVWSRLKAVSPFCTQVICICHLLHCAFNVQYPSYRQILDFYCQNYPVGFTIVN